MANFSIGTVEFKGFNGTLQVAKPVVEQFTRLGSNQTYVQRLKTEAKVSEISCWTDFTSRVDCETQITALSALIGLKQTIVIPAAYSNTTTYTSAYLLDFDYDIKCKVGKHLLTVRMQIKLDENGV